MTQRAKKEENHQQQGQPHKVGYFQMPYPFLHDQHMGLKPIDKLVLQVLASATWDTQKEKKYKKLPYREIAELSGVCIAQLCSTGVNENRPVKKVREGILRRLELGGWIRTMHVQEIPGKGHKNLYVWVDVDKIWAHVPQKNVHTKPKKETYFVHTSSTNANNLLFFPTGESVNDSVHSVNDSVHTSSTNETNIVHTVSTKEGGNTSLIQRNTPSNTYDPQQGLPSNEEKGGGVSLSDKKIVGDHDYLDALVTFLTTREIQSTAPTVPTIVTPVPTLPIARDAISKEEVKEEELLPPTEQVASGYKKPESLVIHDVADIPEQWTLEQMVAWFARQPGALPPQMVHSKNNWPKVETLYQQFPNPRDILLTYGYMRYFDSYWLQTDKTVTIMAVSTCCAKKNVERVKTPEAAIFAKMGITGCPVVYSETDPRNPKWQAHIDRNRQQMYAAYEVKKAQEQAKKEASTHGTY